MLGISSLLGKSKTVSRIALFLDWNTKGSTCLEALPAGHETKCPGLKFGKSNCLFEGCISQMSGARLSGNTPILN